MIITSIHTVFKSLVYNAHIIIIKSNNICKMHILLNITDTLIVRQFGEYFGVNCGFLATSMKFSPMIEFDLVKKNNYGAT